MYNKNKGKKLGTGSAAALKKRRNDLMSFLDDTVTVNRRYFKLSFIKIKALFGVEYY